MGVYGEKNHFSKIRRNPVCVTRWSDLVVWVPDIEWCAYLVDTALGNVVVNDFPGFSKVMVLNFGPLANGSKRDIVSYRTLDGNW